jgi:hypothetical protein
MAWKRLNHVQIGVGFSLESVFIFILGWNFLNKTLNLSLSLGSYMGKTNTFLFSFVQEYEKKFQKSWAIFWFLGFFFPKNGTVIENNFNFSLFYQNLIKLNFHKFKRNLFKEDIDFWAPVDHESQKPRRFKCNWGLSYGLDSIEALKQKFPDLVIFGGSHVKIWLFVCSPQGFTANRCSKIYVSRHFLLVCIFLKCW